MKHPPETIDVDADTFTCDGGGGALGHPRVALTLDVQGEADCPYCGRHFVRAARADSGAKAAAH